MKIKLWTIQDEKGWNELQSKGFLIPKEEFVESHFKNAYDWLKIQMKIQIGEPILKNQYPVWSWYQHCNFNKRRPDLRSSGFLPSGKTGYRIEFKKEKKDILLSEFELWHYVLNKWYLPNDIEDQENFEKKTEKNFNQLDFENYPKYLKNRITKSWLKIFDMDFESKDISVPFKEKKIQATFWKLNIGDIIKVDEFKAR